jgi:hypothetical protein
MKPKGTGDLHVDTHHPFEAGIGRPGQRSATRRHRPLAGVRALDEALAGGGGSRAASLPFSNAAAGASDARGRWVEEFWKVTPGPIHVDVTAVAMPPRGGGHVKALAQAPRDAGGGLARRRPRAPR